MSEAHDPTKPNPFRDANPDAYTCTIPDVAVRRPGLLTAIAIVAVVLGSLGLLSGCLKGFNLAFGAQMQSMFMGFGVPDAAMRKAQEELNAALLAEAQRYLIPNTILVIAQFGLCAALVYSGIKSLQLNPTARKILLVTCALLLLYETGQIVVVVLLQLGIAPIMELHMSRMMRATPGPNNAGAQQFVSALTKFSIIAGMIMQIGWTVIKLVFYGFSVRYLRQEKIVSLFNPAVPDPKPGGAP